MSEANQNLQRLYPFLHGGAKNEQSENAALIASVREKSASSRTIQERFFEDNAQSIIEFSKAIAGIFRNDGKLFCMGNGGSSCDAAHFAVEFQHPVTTGRPALPVINLVADTALLTAVSNDVGVEHGFARQVDALARPCDGLIGFSTSGNSANLIMAYRRAKEIGMVTFGLSGGDGGAMKSGGLVDHCLVVDTISIHRVQEVHVATYHILWDLTHTLLANHRPAKVNL